jgi:hypothetical protein
MITFKQAISVLLLSIAAMSITASVQSKEDNEGIAGTLTKVPFDRSGVNAA